MIDTRTQAHSRDITVEEEFSHSPGTIWKTITTGALIARWLMTPSGFEPVVGNRFTFQTTPAGAWDGVIHCEVLEVEPNERFAFSWRGGHPANEGYGAPLDTVVSWNLERVADGTRVRLVHAGFASPTNDTAFRKMSEGWVCVVSKVGDLSGADDRLRVQAHRGASN